MEKRLDLTRSVFELTQEYPELVEVMAALGFTEITQKPILHSVGKRMTIPKGAGMKNIPMEAVRSALAEAGFVCTGDGQTEVAGEEPPSPAEEQGEGRAEQLKGFLRRLGAGEDLEQVRADFVREFHDVEASEIMRAEQELLKEGTPLTEVQQLCDVHSALFHGATREERIANAERAVAESLKKEGAKADYQNKTQRAAALTEQVGHPLHAFTLENQALATMLAAAQEKLSAGEDVGELFSRIRELSIHYAKKGDLLYPLLKVKYGISGPSDVMWTVDDEIRDELAALAARPRQDEAWIQRAKAALTRADEMIYKEQNILFPICAVNFTEEEWMGIYRDAKDYAPCLGVEPARWAAAEAAAAAPRILSDGEITLPGGHMTPEQLAALLNTIPMEITFVDADNINRFFNEGPKVFKRPNMAIDREVFSCHPPKIEPMVRAIIEDFRAGRQDRVPIWMEKGGRTMLVTYMAVRDREKNYLGTVELVQDMEFAKRHFTQES